MAARSFVHGAADQLRGPAAAPHRAPLSHDGSLGGRENLALWQVDPAADPEGIAAPSVTLKGRLWGCKGEYTAFSQDGTMNLFEAGADFRYASIVLARKLGGVA